MDRKVYDARIQRIQKDMQAGGMAALIATKPQTFFYLSDFNPIIFSHPTIVVLPAQGAPTLLIWSIRRDHARAETVVEDIRLFGRWADREYVALDPYEALGKILADRGLTRGVLGVEEDHLSAKQLRRIRDLAPEATFIDASPIIDRARVVKDAEEIARLRRAAKIADAGMNVAVEAIGERCTEAEASRRAQSAMLELWAREYPDHEPAGFAGHEGAIWSALWCWVVSGPRIEINADTAKSRRIVDGDIALAQIWAVLDGYTAENERTLGVGKISAEEHRVFETVIASHRATMAVLKPGITCHDAFEAAAQVMRKAGYEKLLPGRIGHSIGIGPHEHLSLANGEKTRLVPGMVFSVEPGIFATGINIRHSDTVVITETGCESLTNTPNGLLMV
ncbi:MAG: aminopeptidase P family protein [Armatimonadetes bacterium]|nr:aminopeptidase P family protein [Armatimonadota bacterium]